MPQGIPQNPHGKTVWCSAVSYTHLNAYEMNIEFRAKKSPLKLESFWQEDRETHPFL